MERLIRDVLAHADKYPGEDEKTVRDALQWAVAQRLASSAAREVECPVACHDCADETIAWLTGCHRRVAQVPPVTTTTRLAADSAGETSSK